LVKPRFEEGKDTPMKTLLSAVALSGLLLAASAGNPAAATEDHRRDAPVGVSVWSQAQASSQTELRYVHDNDDDDDYDNPRYQWPNNGNNWNGNWNNNGNNGWNGNNGNWNNGWNNNGNNGWNGSNGNWNNGWNNNWNNQPPYYQNQNYGRPLPNHVIVFRLKQQHFYNVQKIKAKKGYYKVYAFDRHGRPVSVIVNPYTGRILRVGPR
jgi:Peptidase propeptide and YPEB domain